MEIELPDGTVLDAPDDADIKAVVRGYNRQLGIAKLKEQNPAEFDPESPEYRRKFNAAQQIKVHAGIVDPKTGVDLSRLPVEQRDRFFNESAKDLNVMTRQGKPLKNLTKEEQAEFWKQIDSDYRPEMNLENVRAGIGSGMIRGWKGLTNLVLPDSLTPEWASDENIQEMDKRDADLPFLPKLGGSVAGTAPVSAGVGALQRGATALSTASKAPAVLTRALGSAPTRAVLEGSSQGAIYADPEHQGEGALVGAGLGLLLNRGGALLKRANRGFVEKSAEAKALEQLAGQHGDEIFLPVSQAATEETLAGRLSKGFFRDALPLVPGVRGKLLRQGEQAADDLRKIAVKEAVPSGGRLPSQAGTKVSAAVDDLQQQFDDAYDQTVKSYAFNVPKDVQAEVAGVVKAMTNPKTTVNQQTLSKVTGEVEALVKQFSDGKASIDGQNLLNVKREISALLKQARAHEKPVWKAADKWVDDHIVKEMSAGNSKVNAADLRRYLDLTPAYRAFTPLKASANAAADKEGRFLFRTLARNAKNSPEQRAIGQLGTSTVDKSPVTRGVEGRILARLGLGGAGYGAWLDPVTTGLALGGGNVMATKGVQKFLLGDTKIQRKIAEILRNNQKAARRIGSTLRNATVIEAIGE